MTQNEIGVIVIGSICEEAKCSDPSQITFTTTSSEVPGWDSLAHVRIMLGIEMELDIEIPIEATYRAATVGELVELVESVVV